MCVLVCLLVCVFFFAVIWLCLSFFVDLLLFSCVCVCVKFRVSFCIFFLLFWFKCIILLSLVFVFVVGFVFSGTAFCFLILFFVLFPCF